ncbi:unnamed protein product [Caenorhabditis auriculariae]|uniref:Transmembrane protein family 132 middle domain-containing protein n=1 Tax=Caenorhabditis auriculariae TaxID=2777116 RepID=A0A8S1GZ97_9PELO|nr:unnamed protein product [Caenorhabditis auriculariae]
MIPLLPLLGLTSLSAFHVGISPPSDGFLLVHPHQKTNFSTIFVPDDCPISREMRVSVRAGDREHSSRVIPKLPVRCSVRVFLAKRDVDVERPHVDVVAALDGSFAKHTPPSLCVHAKLSASAATSEESSRCELKSDGNESCVMRIRVPFAWFTYENNTVVASYSIGETCEDALDFSGQVPVVLNPLIRQPQSRPLATQPLFNVTLVTSSNLTFTDNSLHSLFVNFSIVETPQPVEIRLWIDSRLSVHNVFPASSDWSIRVTSALRPLFYTSFLCTPLTNATKWEGRVISLLLQMKPTQVIHDDVVLHWHVRMSPTASEKDNEDHKVATKFAVVPDETWTIALVPKRNQIVNTAVISGEQVSVNMRVFAVSFGGGVRDITAESHCISSQSNLLKTSPTCTTVYVDGSEVSGGTSVAIYVHYYRWTSAFSFRVWFPRIPITIWMSDAVIHGVKQWRTATWKELRTSKLRRTAKQFSCGQRFQQKKLKVLASMWVVDERNGEQHYLSTHRHMLLDVTAISINSLHIANKSVATLRFVDGKVLLSGESFGNSKVVLRRASNAKELASEDFVVVAEEASIVGFSTHAVCDIDVDVAAVPFTASFYNVSVLIDRNLTRLYQHCSLQSTLSYSDGSIERLDDVPNDSVIVQAVSNDRALAVANANGKGVELIAIEGRSAECSVEISLSGAEECAQSFPTPFAHSVSLVTMNIASSIPIRTETSTVSLTNPDFSSNKFMLFVLIGFLVIFVFYRLLRKYSAFKGYEQLVAPLISRLSSTSSSAGRDEDTNEWVWLSSSAEPTRSTLGSAYSYDEYSQENKRTPTSGSPSYDDNTKTSVSYRGSEISVFISPTPVVSVNNAPESTGGRFRFARHALVDSTSDHNLARVVSRDDSWNDHHTWTWRKRQDGVQRESVA